MAESLYSLDILRLAASTASFDRLDDPDATVSRRAPLCGSRIDVDVRLDRLGQVEEVGMRVSACALGQASAALMAQHVTGKNLGELARARDDLRAWLERNRDEPGGWPGLEALQAARDHSARHGAINLAFEAVAEAAEAGLARRVKA